MADAQAFGSRAIDVLIVDDDPMIAAEAGNCLKKSGLSCLDVRDGFHALHLLTRGCRVGVVVSDLRMPELDGLQFAERLNGLPDPQRPELVFMSGNAGFDDAVQAIRLHARDLLTKPVAPQTLVRSVKSALQVRQLRSETKAEAPPQERAADRHPPQRNRATLDSLRAVRKVRSQYFPSELFSDPCWEMLLDLYDARLADQQVTVTSLAAASGAPPTTAWRRISALQSHGLIERIDDPDDKRRAIVRLSSTGLAAVENFFETYSRRRPT